jgi:anaerobic magnesium-protoporphyrin IX monomethyl ester cyclase
MDRKKILLINPSMEELYENAYVKDSVPNYPPLNLATIAGGLLDEGHECKIIDLNILPQKLMYDELGKTIKSFKPDVAGITFTSALYSQCMRTISIIKDISPETLIIAGGAHASSDAVSTLRDTQIGIAVMGEGDFTIQEILSGKPLKDIPGIAYKEDEQISINQPRAFLQNMDTLPYPAYQLIDIKKYKVPYVYCRDNPVASIETSRGCAWGCVYCNKSVFGRNFRVKSAERTVEEIKRLIDFGFKEFHINDDMFTTRMDRAKKICQMIVDQGLKIHWNCTNGIRVDRVDEEMFPLMKSAGCYRVAFGVESGNQEILNKIDKGQTLDQVRNAFRLAKKAGLETSGFFMFGLPGEEEKHLKETIRFAKELQPDIAKFDIMIPLPSTPIYKEWDGKYITTKKWDGYGFHKGEQVYNHPNLSWATLKKYYAKAYRSFYLDPRFIARRIKRSIRTRMIVNDLKLFFNVRWFDGYWGA